MHLFCPLHLAKQLTVADVAKGSTLLQVHYKQLIWQNGVKLGTGKKDGANSAPATSGNWGKPGEREKGAKAVPWRGRKQKPTRSDKVCPWPTQCGCNSRQKAKSAFAPQTRWVGGGVCGIGWEPGGWHGRGRRRAGYKWGRDVMTAGEH